MSENSAAREKQVVALSSVAAAFVLTALKLVIGLTTASLGMLSEAAHSGLDLVAALVTFFAVRASDRPPDDSHHYGHGKIENLSALIEALLLVLTCGWIIYEAVDRLFFSTVDVKATPWAFAVMAFSIVVDITRSRALARAARKHRSQALEADALHFSTDIASSAVVIVGLGLVWASHRLPARWAWLIHGDAVAALIVAVIVIWISIRLGKRAIAVLLDAAPIASGHLAAAAAQIGGVQKVTLARVRQAGAKSFVDLTVAVDRGASVEQAHEIVEQVEKHVGKLVDEADVLVHVDPVRVTDESYVKTVGIVVARHEAHAHQIRVRRDQQGDFGVECHVEVPGEMTLAEAHARVKRIEADIRAELPSVATVETHIEPLAQPVSDNAGDSPVEAEVDVRTKVLAAVDTVPELRGAHDVRVRIDGHGFDIILHCVADPRLPVQTTHNLAEELERAIRSQVSNITRLLIHVEPDA